MQVKEVKLSKGCVVRREGDYLVFYDNCWTIPISVEQVRGYLQQLGKDPNDGFFLSNLSIN